MSQALAKAARAFPKNILITECNRGFGIQLTNVMSATFKESNVIAVGNKDVMSMKKMRTNLYVFEMDCDSYMSVSACEKDVEKIIGDNGLNLLINNMVTEVDETTDFDNHPISGHLDRSMLDICGPHIVAKVFLPHLVNASLKSSQISSSSDNIDAVVFYKALLLNLSNFKFPKNPSKNLSSSYNLTRNIVNKSILDSLKKLGVVAVSMFPTDEQIYRSPSFTVVSNVLDFLYKIKRSQHAKYFDWKGNPFDPENL